MRSCFLFICLTVVGSAFGQKFDYGIKAGPNLNYFRSTYEPEPYWVDYKDNYEPYVSFHVGAFMSIDLSDKLSYRQEVEYIVKGACSKAIPQFSISAYKVKVSYLQFPVVFAYKFADKFFVEAGPAFAFLLSSETSNGSSSFIDYITVGVEISAVAGVRYTLSERFDLQARYSLGLTNITDNFSATLDHPDTGDPFETDINFKNRVVSLSALFYFKR